MAIKPNMDTLKDQNISDELEHALEYELGDLSAEELRQLEKIRETERATQMPPSIAAPYSGSVGMANPAKPDGYAALRHILGQAFAQAAKGKGKERHATGPTGFRAWDHQPILQIGRMVGPGYAAGQVQKKVQEAVTMTGNGQFGAAKAEALGAIVYAAALFKIIEEIEKDQTSVE